MSLEDLGFYPSRCVAHIIGNTSRIQNPLTGGVKFVRVPGSRWRIDVGFTSLPSRAAKRLEAYIARQKGGAALTRVRDFTYEGAKTLQGVNVLILNGGALGNTLETEGWGHAGEAALEEGDMLSWIDPHTGLEELHIVTQDVSPLSDGTASVRVEPEIKRPLVAGTVIELMHPGCSAYLVDDGGGVNRAGGLASASLVFEEAIYGV